MDFVQTIQFWFLHFFDVQPCVCVCLCVCVFWTPLCGGSNDLVSVYQSVSVSLFSLFVHHFSRIDLFTFSYFLHEFMGA